MKRFFLLLVVWSQSLAAAEPWPGVKFAEVRAYAWPADKPAFAVILEGMELAEGVINKDGAVLTAEQTKQVISAVTGDRPAYPVAACHTPHNAFVFYDVDKKPVAFVEICFKCNSRRMSPKGNTRYVDLVALASGFEAHQLPIGKYQTAADYEAALEGLKRLMEETKTSK
jgi:hypothetical protein